MAVEIQALVGCQVQECAEEISYYLDMVRIYNGEPICQNCHDGCQREDEPRWVELPEVTLEMLIA